MSVNETDCESPRCEAYLVTCPGSWHGLEPSLGHGRRGSLRWLSADVRPSPMAYPAMRPLPAQTPAPYIRANLTHSTARHADYRSVQLRVRPEPHRGQSCAIALRAPLFFSSVYLPFKTTPARRSLAFGSRRTKGALDPNQVLRTVPSKTADRQGPGASHRR